MGTHILCTTQETAVSLRKTGWRKLIPTLPRKVERNPIPVQLSKILDKLEKVIKKQSTNLKKRHRDKSNSDST